MDGGGQAEEEPGGALGDLNIGNLTRTDAGGRAH
jgi:hypothetical protein